MPPLVGPLGLAGLCSLAAGAIHGAAVGVHRQERAAALAFAVLALAQLAWGLVALRRSGPAVAAPGVVLGGVGVSGWVLAKTRGVTFVDGLETVEQIQWSDAAAAGLALVSGLLALRRLAEGRRVASAPRPAVARGAVVLLTVVTVGAMVGAPGHLHGDHDDDQHRHGAGVRSSQPYDPSGPIDLSGGATVTAEEQARAEDLVRRAVEAAPAFADRDAAVARGWASMGDAASGYEHLYRPDLVGDGATLEVEAPEGLVYEVDGDGERTLAGLVFLLDPRTSLAEVPELGGALTVWSLRRDLCFGPAGRRAEVARSDAGGRCPGGTEVVAPTPELPVWVVANRCGPFVAPPLTGDDC